MRFRIHWWTACRPCCWLWSTWLWWRTERSSFHAALWPQGCAPDLSAKQQLLNCLWRQLQSDQGEVQIHPVPGNSQVWKLQIKIQWGLKIRTRKTKQVVSTSAFLVFFHGSSYRGVYFQWHSHWYYVIPCQNFIFFKAAMAALNVFLHYLHIVSSPLTQLCLSAECSSIYC